MGPRITQLLTESKIRKDHPFMSISCQNQFCHKQYSHPIILPISAQRKPASLCRVCNCCCKICSLGLPTKPFLATVERRSFRDDGAVNVERSESSKILSKSLESSFIRKTSSFSSEITSTSFGKASSIPRVKVTRVLYFNQSTANKYMYIQTYN